MQEKYYLYRHIRLDKNEPFYIGIGVIYDDFPTARSRYERAFSKLKRNPYWSNIINKTNYDVEIMIESDSREFIIQKEIEFIKLYGRKDNNTGILSNMTNGGDGGNGSRKFRKIIISEETRKKLSLIHKGRPHTNQMIKVFKFDLNNNFIKEYPSILSTKLDGFDTKSVSRCCNNLSKAHKGYVFKYNKINN